MTDRGHVVHLDPDADPLLPLLPAAGSLALRIDVVEVDDPTATIGRLARALWAAGDVLARRGVGLAILHGPDVDADEVLGALGRCVVPVTAHRDAAVVDAWIEGQLVAGPVRARPIAGSRSTGGSALLHDYVLAHGEPEGDPVSEELAAETVRRYGALAGMNIGQDQGRFLRLLAELLVARTAIEVGTFTGMSALWIARGLADGGRLICCDVSDEYPAVGRRFWEEAGVADRIEVRVGPALETIRAMPAEPHVDLAFVDADKTGYAAYVEELLPRLRPGGVIAIDNVLWGGAVIDETVTDADTVALRTLNDDLAADPDLDVLMLTIGDGVTLVRKR
jgi:caffeoyl-CoA O-methyltransferase